VGWAFVQISNMAVVNSITFSTQRRDRLISLRNGFTFVANLTVLSIALVLFAVMKDPITQFRVLAFLIVAGGTVSSLFYIFTLREPKLVKEAKQIQKEFKLQQKCLFREEEKAKKSVLSAHVKQWHEWFTEGQFYVYGFVYMLVRIAVNVTMSVQPFYLIHVTGFVTTEDNPTPIAIALTPLVSYITSLIFSLMLYKPMLQRLRNRFYPLFISIMIISLGSLPYVFLNSNPNVRWMVYLLSSI